jgi:hypothetical protein
MPVLRPRDIDVLATAVVDTLVVSADPDARGASRTYWELSRIWTRPVVAAVKAADEPIPTLAVELLANPADPARYAAVKRALLESDPASPTIEAVYDQAWHAECNSRIGLHLGTRYRNKVTSVSADELSLLDPGVGLPAGANPPVLVVIPFRDRDAGGIRLRNLLACLLALRDQSMPRDQYAVTVVESDDEPRWRHVISRYADRYLFAPKAGAFNRSWTLNVGVVNTPGDAEIVCVMDADVLADRDFVARNVGRFLHPGRGGHLPYRNLLFLTEESTAWSIGERLHRKRPDVHPEDLRGFSVRRPPGCCGWVRAEAFRRIGGMDERYEGWGGEDNDFAHRYDIDAPLDIYDDLLLHMHHPLASRVRTREGELANTTIPPRSWGPDWAIGQIDRFSPRQDGQVTPSAVE